MTLNKDDLDAAVRAGVIDFAARDRLLAFSAGQPAGDEGPDAENFRLLTGFNDIFVTLACALVLGALAALIPDPAATVVVGAVAWGFAEYFTRRRRMALPSILLLLVFVICVTALAFQLVSGGGHWGLAAQQMLLHGNSVAMLAPVMVAGLAGGLAAAVHWWRFRVPITLAAGAATLTICCVALARAVFQNSTGMWAAVLVMGLCIFALAMRYDISDRKRLTRNTDIAFWLHLLAAPLIVHSIVVLTGINSQGLNPVPALAVLLAYMLFTLVAVAIDRRALLVSAMIYVLLALNALFSSGKMAEGFGLTALVLGSFLVMLSAGWGFLRRRLLGVLPARITEWLPSPA